MSVEQKQMIKTLRAELSEEMARRAKAETDHEETQAILNVADKNFVDRTRERDEARTEVADLRKAVEHMNRAFDRVSNERDEALDGMTNKQRALGREQAEVARLRAGDFGFDFGVELIRSWLTRNYAREVFVGGVDIGSRFVVALWEAIERLDEERNGGEGAGS